MKDLNNKNKIFEIKITYATHLLIKKLRSYKNYNFEKINGNEARDSILSVCRSHSVIVESGTNRFTFHAFLLSFAPW